MFNDRTGYYELNGLVDITEEQMADIYVASSDFYLKSDTKDDLHGSIIRTNLHKKNKPDGNSCSIKGVARDNSNLEVFRIAPEGGDGFRLSPMRVTDISNAFIYSTNLERIIGIIYLGLREGIKPKPFEGCSALREVKLHGLTIDLSFQWCPKISYESLKFLVDYAANTEAITITVHPKTYTCLTGASEPAAEAGGTAEEWTALVTSAAAKNISFATTE